MHWVVSEKGEAGSGSMSLYDCLKMCWDAGRGWVALRVQVLVLCKPELGAAG